MKETADLWKELLNIPDNYHVLFLGGGASTQFFDVPANLLKSKAAYLETGSWAKKAIKEAKFYGEVEVVASSADKNFSYIPKGYSIPEDVDYFHITSNNTIYGTEIHEDIDSPVTLVADMSSDIMSRPVIIIPPDASIQDAVGLMLEHQINSLVVTEDGDLRGVLKRDDIIKEVAK